MDIRGRKIGILGLARSGLAAAEKAALLGADVLVSEIKEKKELPELTTASENIRFEFGGHSDEILKNDLIIVSPGIPASIPILEKASVQGIELISEIEFGYRIKHPDSKIIAITGSNGKSTTVSLIYHLLRTAGIPSVLGGNIGTAFTSLPIEKAGIDIIVLEISSFQLELIGDFKPDVAAVLNLTPDHLNRYKDFWDYAKTKFRIFDNQTRDEDAVLNFDDNAIMGMPAPRKPRLLYFSLKHKTDICCRNNLIEFGEQKIDTTGFQIRGPHNQANIMAALLATRRWLPKGIPLEESLASFSPLPHRLEFVREYNGVRFFNDSKATNTESVKYALQSFPEKIRIIMGGAGKGEDYTVLKEILDQKARKIYLIGEERYEMYIAFRKIADSKICKSFSEAIHLAYSDSDPGDIVLLSPGCTSFDMFNNFEERGDFFKQIVMELK